MTIKHNIGITLLAIGLLFWAPAQMVNAQSVVKDIEIEYDQSRQLWNIEYHMRRKLSFKEEAFILPVITVQGDTVALRNGLAGVYGWQPGPKKARTYNITWDPFQDGVTDWQDLQVNIVDSVRLKPLPRFWSLSWHGSNSAPFGLRLSRIAGRRASRMQFGNGFFPKLSHKLRQLAPVGGFVEYRRGLPPPSSYSSTYYRMNNYEIPDGYSYSQFTGKFYTEGSAIIGGLTWQIREKWYLNVGVGIGSVQQYAWVEYLNFEGGEKFEEALLYDPYYSSSSSDPYYCYSCWAIDISMSTRLGRWLLDLGAGNLSGSFLATYGSSFHVIGGIGYVINRMPHQ